MRSIGADALGEPLGPRSFSTSAIFRTGYRPIVGNAYTTGSKEESMGQKPSIGRKVHYRLPVACGPDEWRGAEVVQVFDGGRCNLTVFLDQANDSRHYDHVDAMTEQGMSLHGVGFLAAVGSAEEGTEPGNWRWPPRV